MVSLNVRSRILFTTAIVAAAGVAPQAAFADCLPNASTALVVCSNASPDGYATPQNGTTIEVAATGNVTKALSVGSTASGSPRNAVNNFGVINTGTGPAIVVNGGGLVTNAATATGNLNGGTGITGNIIMGDTSGDQVNGFYNRKSDSNASQYGTVAGNFVSTGKTEFLNEGVFNGNIITGTGDDAVYNYGTINGTIKMGGGNNTLGISADTNFTTGKTVIDNSGGGTYTLDLGGSKNATLNQTVLNGFNAANFAATNFTNVTKSGTSIWTVDVPMPVKGTVTVNAGSLEVTNASYLGADTVVNNATVQFTGNAPGVYSGNMSGTGKVVIGPNTGLTTFSGNNTYSGGTLLTGGALAVTGGNALLSTGDVTFDGASGGLLQVNGSQTIGSLNGTPTGTLMNANSVGVAIAKDQTLTVGAGSFGFKITGAGALTKNTTGTLVLAGNNDYAGGTTVSAGTLQGTTSSLQGDIANNATLNFVQTTDGTYAGNLSGTGVLNIGLAAQTNAPAVGGGTVTFSGVNTMAGAVNVNAGTFDAAGGKAVSDSSTVNVASGATFQLSADETVGQVNGAGAINTQAFTLTAGGNNTNGTLSGTLAGNGFTKTGTGTLTLSGKGALTGAANVNAGTVVITDKAVYSSGTTNVASGATLNVNSGGSLKSTTVTNASGGTLVDNGTITGAVNNNGTLSGNGTVVGKLTNAGTISPGNSPGIFNVNGSFVQTSTGTYKAELSPDGTAGTGYDQIKVTGTPGTATLGGTLALSAPYNVYYTAGTNYDVVTATGGISGNFSSITGSVLSPFISFANTGIVSTGGTSQAYRETLKRTSYAEGMGADATANQIRTANGFQNLITPTITGDAKTAVTTVDFMTQDQAKHFFDEASPEGYGAYVNTLQDQGMQWERMVALRLLNIQMKNEISNAVWMNGYGSWGNNKHSRQNLFGTRERMWGLAGGADMGNENYSLGVSGGYSKSKNRYGLGNMRGTNKSWQVGGYGATLWKGISVNALIGYVHGKLNANRDVTLWNNYMTTTTADASTRTAKGDTKGHQFRMMATFGYNFGFTTSLFEKIGMQVRPYVGFDFATGRYKGFTESGADALNLTVRRMKTNKTDVLVGLNATGQDRKFSPYLRMEYRYAVKRAKRWVSAYFNGDDTTAFTVASRKVPVSTVNTDLGVSYDLLGKATIYAGYQGQWRKHNLRNGVTGGVRVNF